MALGARPSQLWWSVQREGIGLAAAGALLGFAGAVAGAGLFSSLAYGVSVRDPLSLAAGPVLILIAAFLAAAIPATRAVRVSPIAVLRDS
jgi:ABC-type antimicrobial peptide transport system permease subunit